MAENRSTAKVSVIIPLYNKERYILRALDSVFAQTYQDYEVVVVDDGSTDGGPDLAEGYRDDRLRMVRQENAGPGAARNRGIRESTGRFISFLDADDEWLPEFLEKSVTTLQHHPQCVLTICGYFQGADRVDWKPVLRKEGITNGIWRLPPNMSPEAMKYAIDFFASWATVARRQIIERYGGFYEKRCTYGEDTYLWLQIALNHAVYRYLEPLVWHHTEASELGAHGRRMICPPRPMLTDPDPIRDNCPPNYRPLLEKCLAFYAMQAVHRHARRGDRAVCLNLLSAYPQMRMFLWDYLRAQAWVSVIPLIHFVQSRPRLRHLVRRIRGMRPPLERAY